MSWNYFLPENYIDKVIHYFPVDLQKTFPLIHYKQNLISGEYKIVVIKFYKLQHF